MGLPKPPPRRPAGPPKPPPKRPSKPEKKKEIRAKKVEPMPSIPEELLGQRWSANALINRYGSLKKVLGSVRPDTYPNPNDIDMNDVEVDLTGDIDSHVIMKWRNVRGTYTNSYTAGFRARNNAEKWERAGKLIHDIDRIRDEVSDIMQDRSADYDVRDAAAIMFITAHTGLRPGSKHDTAEGVYGAKTLRAEHVSISGSTVSFKFNGKRNVENTAKIKDKHLAKYLQKRRNSARKRGGEMFIESPAAMRQVKQITDSVEFLLKDYRTVIGTTAAAEALLMHTPPPPLPDDEKAALKLMKDRYYEASEATGKILNNEPRTARGSYISPGLLYAWATYVGASHDIVDAILKKGSPLDEIHERARRMMHAAFGVSLHTDGGPFHLAHDDLDNEPQSLELYDIPDIFKREA
jgi:DNA topoisomerase-1